MVSVKFVIFRSRGGSEEIKGVRACMMVVVVVVNGQLVNGGVYFVFPFKHYYLKTFSVV